MSPAEAQERAKEREGGLERGTPQEVQSSLRGRGERGQNRVRRKLKVTWPQSLALASFLLSPHSS